MIFDLEGYKFPENYFEDCNAREAKRKQYIKKEWIKECSVFGSIILLLIGFIFVVTLPAPTGEVDPATFTEGETVSINGETYTFKTFPREEVFYSTDRYGNKYLQIINDNGQNYIPLIENEETMQATINVIQGV